MDTTTTCTIETTGRTPFDPPAWLTDALAHLVGVTLDDVATWTPTSDVTVGDVLVYADPFRGERVDGFALVTSTTDGVIVLDGRRTVDPLRPRHAILDHLLRPTQAAALAHQDAHR